MGVSYIELDRPVPPETCQQVEDRCNRAIRDAVPVTVSVYQHGDPQLDTVKILIRGGCY